MARLNSLRLLAISAALSGVPAITAHAQLGRLKKLGAEAVKDKLAGGDKKDSAATATKPGTPAAAASSAAAPAATAKKGNYTITESRVALVLANLQPLLAEAERRAASENVQRDYAAKRKTAMECMEKASSNFDPASLMTANPQRDARMEAIQKQAEAASARLNRATQGGNARVIAFVRDTSDVLQMQMAVTQVGASCVIPFAPAAVIDGQLSASQRQASGAERANASFDANAEAKAAMTTVEFGMIRERIALFALQQDNPSLELGSAGQFTADERAVLSARASELKRYAPLFKGGSLRWQTWADLKGW
jgi:hypothetical protein